MTKNSHPPKLTKGSSSHEFMTRHEVAAFLGISVECLSKNRKKWESILPRIEFNSRFIRYRKADVLKLSKGGKHISLRQIPQGKTEE
jgi:hypothetical protein